MIGTVLDGTGALIGDAEHELGGIDPRWALAALACHVANHLLRAVAWRNVLLAALPDRRLPLVQVATAYAAGVAVNGLAPARGGDAVKIGLVRARLPGASVATIAATLPVLVVFDGLAASVLVLAVGLSGGVPLGLGLDPGSATGWLGDHAVAAAAIAAAVIALGRLVAASTRRRLRSLWERVRQGGAILRTPRRYLRGVALVQSGAWCCRIAVVFCLLAAFGLPASVPTAALVMVLTGVSAIVPLTPGGVGTQQVVLAVALSQMASAATVLSFSIGMQAGVTLVNAALGIVAAMTMCGSVRPIAAVRSGLRLARAGGSAG